MATIQRISDLVRTELGDLASTFDITVVANGVATRFETGTYPLDGTKLTITVNGVVVNDAVVEERTGVVTFDVAPADGADVRFTGTKFRYFGSADMEQFVRASVAEQTHNRTDTFGRAMTIDNLPFVEEYPLAILATTKALYALLTDASFDIDIYAPDGVSIPRSQRHRQLAEMVEARKQQYHEYATALNIGLDRIEVFQLRRVSAMTGRLVPIWQSKEIEDNSKPVRVYLPTNTYGGTPVASPIIQKDFSLVRGDSFLTELNFGYDVTGFSVVAQVKLYADSQTTIVPFGIANDPADPTSLILKLTPSQTQSLPLQTVWDIQLTSMTDPEDVRTPFGGRIYADRDVTR